jgi:putative transposase
MVAHPGGFDWSSYRAHAGEGTDGLVKGHDVYDRLGVTPAERAAAYRALFDAALDVAFVEALRVATNGGWAFGGERFKRQIAEVLARRVEPAPKGRPRKAAGTDDQLNLL